MVINVVIFQFKENYYLAIDHAEYNKINKLIPILTFSNLEDGYTYFLLSIAGDFGCNLGGLGYIKTFLSSIVKYETGDMMMETLFPNKGSIEGVIQTFTNNDDHVVGMLIEDQVIAKREWDRGQHIIITDETMDLMRQTMGKMRKAGIINNDSVIH